MPTEVPELQPHQFLPVGFLFLGLLVWGRVFTRDAFAAAPDRRVGLSILDLFAGIGLTFLGMTIYQGVARVLGISPDGPPAEKIGVVLLSQVCVQLLPVLYLAARAGAAPGGLVKIGLVPTQPWRDVLAGIAGFLISGPVVLAVLVASSAIATWLGHPPEPMAHDLLPLVHDPRTTPQVLALLFAAVVVVAPLLEEAVYRGLMQSTLVESLGGRRWWGLLITAVIFAFVHAGSVEPPALAGLFVLAVALGWLYERTGSLWPGIVLHALFNGFNLAMASLLAPGSPSA